MLALDRLFLSGLVEEARADWVGTVVRRVEADRSVALLALETSRRETGRIVVSSSRDVPGLYWGWPPGSGPGAAPVRVPQAPGLKKWLLGARITNVTIAAVDRIVTLELERTRLSGRKHAVAVVLEIAGPRVAAFVLDLEEGTVIEGLGKGRKRLGPGDPYDPPAPPPGAAPLAADAAEVSRRLEASGAGAEGMKALLAATGATPLLVSEMKFLARREGLGLLEAFERVRARLRAPRPTIYDEADRILLSPIELESRREAGSEAAPSAPGGRGFESFNAAMAAAVALAWERVAFRDRTKRLQAVIAAESAKLTRLRAKLEREAAEAEEPSVLRRYGELVLAGIGRARRLRDDVVVVPDVFSPDAPPVEIAIDPRLGLPANAERFFRRAKKRERAAVALARRAETIEARLSSLESLEVALVDAESLAALAELESEAEELGLVSASAPARRVARPAPAPLGPRVFPTSRGGRILVGRSSKGNDELTFARASAEDVWLHAAGRAGAHVVVRPAEGADLSEGEIFEAAGLAAFYSKAKSDSHVEVMVTTRKQVSKIKGAPAGAVRVHRYRTVRVRPRPPGEPSEKVN